MNKSGSITVLFIVIFQIAFSQESIFKRHLVYEEPLMDSIKSQQINYKDSLKADLYFPMMKVANESFPCVIFVSGFARINFRKVQGYIDWAKLMAAHGIIGIVYETSSPGSDFDYLTNYIVSNAKNLHLDPDRIGIWSCSGNSLLAVNKVNSTDQFKCHSIYYGLTTTLNSKYLNEVKDMSGKNGFAYEIKSEYVSKVPTLIVRSGLDHWELVIKTTDEFINELLSKNLPFELINYDQGSHSFDISDNNDTSREIILKTVAFFKKRLK